MKNTFLLLAVCLTAQLSFGQDRREGLIKLNTDRDEAVDVRRHVIRKVNRNVIRDVRYHVLVDAMGWHGASAYGNYRPRGAAQYYYYVSPNSYSMRDEIRREIRRTRNVVRQEIRSAFRFWRE